MKRISTAVAIFLVLFLPVVSFAAPQWSFDPPHGEIMFRVKHILGTVSGHFEQYKGAVFFDPRDVAHSSIDVTIDVKSFNTRVEKRDEHMRSDEFFDAAKYPVITFKSDKIESLGNNKYVAKGKLTVKDVTREIDLPFTFLGIVKNPLVPDTLVAGFNGHLTIDRLEYHVGTGKFYQMGVLGKDVDVVLSFELLRKEGN